MGITRPALVNSLYVYVWTTRWRKLAASRAVYIDWSTVPYDTTFFFSSNITHDVRLAREQNDTIEQSSSSQLTNTKTLVQTVYTLSDQLDSVLLRRLVQFLTKFVPATSRLLTMFQKNAHEIRRNGLSKYRVQSIIFRGHGLQNWANWEFWLLLPKPLKTSKEHLHWCRVVALVSIQ